MDRRFLLGAQPYPKRKRKRLFWKGWKEKPFISVLIPGQGSPGPLPLPRAIRPGQHAGLKDPKEAYRGFHSFFPGADPEVGKTEACKGASQRRSSEMKNAPWLAFDMSASYMEGDIQVSRLIRSALRDMLGYEEARPTLQRESRKTALFPVGCCLMRLEKGAPPDVFKYPFFQVLERRQG